MTALRLSIRVFLEQVDTAFDIYEHQRQDLLPDLSANPISLPL